MKKCLILSSVLLALATPLLLCVGKNNPNAPAAGPETSLTIKNESPIELRAVRWNGVEFGNIPTSTPVTREVTPGSGKISFTIAGKEISATSQHTVEVRYGEKKEFAFAANTSVVETNDINFANTAMLSSLEKARPPKVGKIEMTEVSSDQIKVVASVADSGWPKYTEEGGERGFCYSRGSPVGIGVNCQTTVPRGDYFWKNFTGLADSEKYYIVAYIDNKKHSRVYSDTIAATTSSGVPIVGGLVVVDTGYDSVRVRANVLFAGVPSYANGGEAGFCLAEDSLKLDESCRKVDGAGSSFYRTISGLSEGRVHYLKAYIDNYHHTHERQYSEVITFTTRNGAPVVSALTERGVGRDSVRVQADVIFAGYPSYIDALNGERGFSIWEGGTVYPEEYSQAVEGTSSSFATTFYGLEESTRYVIRAYVDNGKHKRVYGPILMVVTHGEMPIYTVSFDVNGGFPEIDPVDVDSGGTLGENFPTNPVRAGYTFGGWSYGSAQYYPSTVITRNVPLVAKWTVSGVIVRRYIVSFNLSGGDPSVDPMEVDSGYALGANFPANPTRVGYKFDGWFYGSAQYYSSTAITSNVTLVARWTAVVVPRYTVTFSTNGGTPATISSVAVDSGATLGNDFPTHIARMGYTFDGWFDARGTQYASNTAITANTTLAATWSTTRYTVSFNTNGGIPKTIGAYTVDTGRVSGTRFPEDPMRDGEYVFMGWFDGLERYYSNTIITKSVMLVAKYSWPGETLFDPRDGAQYRTTVIGDQVWMAENLNYEIGSGSFCYNNAASNCESYGRLYTWSAAMSACPDDWRLPTSAEWDTLVAYAGGSGSAGKALKSTIYSHGTDDYGFSAMLGGYRGFYNLSSTGYWWSATEYSGYSTYAEYRNITTSDGVGGSYNDKTSTGYSARCVPDD